MHSIFQALYQLEQQNESAALCIIVRSKGATPRHTSSKMLVYPDGRILGSVGGGEVENRVIAEAIQALKDGRPRLLSYNMIDPGRGDPGVCGGQLEVFVEPVQPKPVVLVIGAGHVGKAVAHLAQWLGFHVAVSDDRPGFCSSENFPEAHEYHPCIMSELPQRFRITPWTYIVLTTRGYDVDVEGLPALLDTPAAYIGVIGSRRRWEMTCKQIFAKGVSEKKVERVYSPIGLELKAETPEEIAVSIMAQIILLRALGAAELPGKTEAATPLSMAGRR